MGRRLRSWAVQHDHVLSPTGPGPISSHQKYCAMELRYALSTCWVMIQRRIVTAQSRNTRLEHARASLKLFEELCGSYQHGDGISGFAVFEKYAHCPSTSAYSSDSRTFSICLNYSMLSFLEVYIHLIESHDSDDQTDYDSISFFASKAECLAANASTGSYSSKIRHVTGLCNQISESLRSLKEGNRAQSLSAAVSPRPTTASTDQGPGGDLFGPGAIGSFPAGSGVPDPFWDVYSFPLQGSLDSDKINMAHRAQAHHGDLMDNNSLFLMSEETTSHMMPTDPVDFDSFLNVIAGGNHDFGGTI